MDVPIIRVTTYTIERRIAFATPCNAHTIMYVVNKEIEFCYGHRLLNYDGKCQHLHGHNARAVIRLERATLDKLGMVVDFSEISRVVGHWIDETLDHTMLLHKDDPFLALMRDAGEKVYVMDLNPTAENIARHIFDYVETQGYPVTEVALWETSGACARYLPNAD